MFVFDCNEIIGYNEYLDFLSSLKSCFESERNALFDRYSVLGRRSAFDADSYDEFRHRYRDLRQGVIRNALSRFRAFLPAECLVYEFGSLAKYTDRIESDVDLTICYDSPKSEIYECAEELIDYTIAAVFRQTIDHIHGKFQHYPIVRRYDGVTEVDNSYALCFGRERIEYKCGPETLQENLMHIKNARDYRSLLDGYREKYALKCNIDCLYSMLVLENSSGHDFIGDLTDLEANNEIFNGYRYEERQYALSDAFEISFLKGALKDTVVAVYTMIAYWRKSTCWLHRYSMTMDDVFQSIELRTTLGAGYLDRLRCGLLAMVFYWDKIELMLKQQGVPLSTRCHRVFSSQEFGDMLCREYDEHGLLEETMCAINALNSLVTEGWVRMPCKR